MNWYTHSVNEWRVVKNHLPAAINFASLSLSRPFAIVNGAFIFKLFMLCGVRANEREKIDQANTCVQELLYAHIMPFRTRTQYF